MKSLQKPNNAAAFSTPPPSSAFNEIEGLNYNKGRVDVDINSTASSNYNTDSSLETVVKVPNFKDPKSKIKFVLVDNSLSGLVAQAGDGADGTDDDSGGFLKNNAMLKAFEQKLASLDGFAIKHRSSMRERTEDIIDRHH